jgi:hypothetical protein
VKTNVFRKSRLFLLPLSVAVLAGGDQPWKDKQVPEWNAEDAKEILNDSPWAKSVKPTVTSANNGQHRSGGGLGRAAGIGLGGIGIGLPGMGGLGRRVGMGGPGGGSGSRGDDGADYSEPPALMLRLESALLVREAELKARETNAPTLDEDYYAIAVYGVPRGMAIGDSQNLASQLKKQSSIKRDGKTDLKPSSVEVLQREDGPVIVYLFPRSHEITRQDKRIEFDAQIGRLQFSQSFFVDDMTWQDKLEL